MDSLPGDLTRRIPIRASAAAGVDVAPGARAAAARAPRVVVDVSTTLAWHRPPVGIVRTEQNLVAFMLAQQELDVLFCRFDRMRGEHVLVPRDTVRRHLAGREQPPPPAADAPLPAASPPAARGPRLRERARARFGSAVRRTIDRLPAGVRPEAVLFAESSDLFVRSVYWLGRRGLVSAVGPSRGVSAAVAASDEPASAVLGPGDVYVSIGLDWEHNDLGALARLKQARGFRTLLQCYDLIPIRFPHFTTWDAREYYSRYFLALARVADRVTTISQATLEDFRRFLLDAGAAVPPMSVLHLGTDVVGQERRANVAAPRPDLAERPFVLCVGTIEARKNHELLYQIWDRLVATHGERTPLLVLVGMCGWGVDDLLARLRVNRNVADRIVVLDRVDDDALVWLYEHCLFTVFPSFCEGLGLPVVESLALGKPCVVSDAPAVVEAAQGLVPMLDPLDFPAWYRQVERWAFDPDATREAALALRAYRAQSWRGWGESMLALVREVGAAPATARARRDDP